MAIRRLVLFFNLAFKKRGFLFFIYNFHIFLELFHGAVLQSGHALFPELYNTGKEAAFAMGRTLDKNFESENSTALLGLLQQAPADDILKVKFLFHIL